MLSHSTFVPDWTFGFLYLFALKITKHIHTMAHTQRRLFVYLTRMKTTWKIQRKNTLKNWNIKNRRKCMKATKYDSDDEKKKLKKKKQ